MMKKHITPLGVAAVISLAVAACQPAGAEWDSRFEAPDDPPEPMGDESFDSDSVQQMRLEIDDDDACEADGLCLDLLEQPLDLSAGPGGELYLRTQRRCRLQMIDTFNQIDTVIEVARTSTCSLVVTDHVGTEGAWSVDATLQAEGRVHIDAGVPQVTCETLIEDYEVFDSEQLTFHAVPNHPCSSLQESLIFFMVMEWFYFG